MPRVKRGFTRHRRHVAILKQVEGHRTTRGHLFRTANQELLKSLMYAYRDRRTKKRDMRALWITRINAAARINGLPYSRFISGLGKIGITIDRKMLAEMAVNDPHGFAVLASQIKGESAPVYTAPVVPVPVVRTSTGSVARTSTGAATTVFSPAPAVAIAEPVAPTETVAEIEAEVSGNAPETAGNTDPTSHGGSERDQ